MKKLGLLFLFVTTLTLSYTQNLSSRPAFSNFSLGLYGGISTFEFHSFEGAARLELQSNLVKDIYLNFSVGHYTFNKNQTHTYKGFHPYEDGFAANVFNSTKYNYKVTPVTIGFSYYFDRNQHSVPYIVLEGGYNFYERESNVSRIIKTDYYNSIEQIPDEYKTSDKKDSFNLGVGFGILHNHSKHWKWDIRYIYKYNTIFDNINQIIVGCNYLF